MGAQGAGGAGVSRGRGSIAMPHLLQKGQLIFINRTVYANEEEFNHVNEPAIFLRKEAVELAGGTYDRWWFIDADGNEDFIQGMDGHVDAPRTVEELFGFKPLL